MSIRLTEPKEILDHFQKYSPKGREYYLYDTHVISNVPIRFYDEQNIFAYQNPQKLSDEQTNLIQTIKEVIDCIHSVVPLKLGNCFDNSSIIFDGLRQIQNLKLDTKLVFGIYSHKVPISESQDGYIFDNDQIRVHDWHVWNYVNSLLVDTTILRKQHSITTFVNNWGNSEDHVFGFTNHDDQYRGISFDDYEKFELYFRNLFNV